MSPAKSKDPSPPKKNKQTADDSKPAAPARKSSKSGDAVDSANAVSTGLTAADDTPAATSAAAKAPKVSRAKIKAAAPVSPAEGGDQPAPAVSDAAAPAPVDLKPKGGRAGTGTQPSAAVPADSAQPAKDSAPPSGGDLPAKSSDLQPKSADTKAVAPAAPATGTSPKAGAAASASPMAAPKPDAQTMPPPAAGPASDVPRTPSPAASKNDTGAGSDDQAPDPSAPAAPAAAAAEKPMELPKGAFIAYRKSGGLKFSSREVVVYPDGRVTFDGGDTAKTSLTRAARRMSDAQIMRLRRTLEQINFFGMHPPASAPDPDGFVLEIAARLGSKNNAIEVNAAGLSGGLTALVDQLTQLLPAEE